MHLTLAEYRVFKFPQYPRLQKICRILFLLTLILSLFARIGVNWETRPFTPGNAFICLMNVWLIYYVVCYSIIIVFLWVAKYLLKCLFFLLRFIGYVLIWLQYETTAWINGR